MTAERSPGSQERSVGPRKARGMEIGGITMVSADQAELLDALEEIRSLVWLAEEGTLDLGPALRSLLGAAYAAADKALAEHA